MPAMHPKTATKGQHVWWKGHKLPDVGRESNFQSLTFLQRKKIRKALLILQWEREEGKEREKNFLLVTNTANHDMIYKRICKKAEEGRRGNFSSCSWNALSIQKVKNGTRKLEEKPRKEGPFLSFPPKKRSFFCLCLLWWPSRRKKLPILLRLLSLSLRHHQKNGSKLLNRKQ